MPLRTGALCCYLLHEENLKLWLERKRGKKTASNAGGCTPLDRNALPISSFSDDNHELCAVPALCTLLLSPANDPGFCVWFMARAGGISIAIL
jgi:hypothetical protein